MSRHIFCHEEELLRRFAAIEFNIDFSWDGNGLEDDVWGEEDYQQSKRKTVLFNPNFRTIFSGVPFLKDTALTKVAQVHPGYLNPAIFLVVDRVVRKVHSIELLNGDFTQLDDYPLASSRIIEIANQLTHPQDFKKHYKWLRLFAMFDAVFFLVAVSEFRRAATAQRQLAKMPPGMTGQCVILHEKGKFIGIEGWFEHPTGFGVEATV